MAAAPMRRTGLRDPWLQAWPFVESAGAWRAGVGCPAVARTLAGAGIAKANLRTRGLVAKLVVQPMSLDSCQYPIAGAGGQAHHGAAHAPVRPATGQEEAVNGFVEDIAIRRQDDGIASRLGMTSLLVSLQPERLFHGFLEASPDAVVIIDGSGMVVHVNSQTEKLFGYCREELVGRPLEMLMPERFRGRHVAQRTTYVADARPRSMGRGLDLFGVKKDGREFPIDVSISPLPPERGVLFASAIRDVTDHRRLEDELRARSRELEEADRQKNHFLSAVAHELRSPLSALAYVAPILLSPQVDAAALQRASRLIERQTAHMARLVEDLLDLARLHHGKITLHRESIDLRTVVPLAVEFSQSLIETRKHELEVALSAEPLWVSGDPTRLAQVMTNLLSNAAKFTPEGGHIRLITAREDGVAVIRVGDDGAGIPAEMLSRVFEWFTQIGAEGDDRAGGLGIGLSLVRRLVELHGGTATAFSEGLGRGSQFVVRLPLLPAGPDDAESGAAADGGA